LGKGGLGEDLTHTPFPFQFQRKKGFFSLFPFFLRRPCGLKLISFSFFFSLFYLVPKEAGRSGIFFPPPFSASPYPRLKITRDAWWYYPLSPLPGVADPKDETIGSFFFSLPTAIPPRSLRPGREAGPSPPFFFVERVSDICGAVDFLFFFFPGTPMKGGS